LANEYNGIAYNGKITMFDIDINDNFLNVPSLYNIALPPAYGAGPTLILLPPLPSLSWCHSHFL
jgi:hypothetical protein